MLWNPFPIELRDPLDTLDVCDDVLELLHEIEVRVVCDTRGQVPVICPELLVLLDELVFIFLDDVVTHSICDRDSVFLRLFYLRDIF